MNHSQPLANLQVIGVRYRRTDLAANDERSLDAYAASNVYATAGVPFDVVEPRFPEEQRVGFEPDNIGVLGGHIADAVADAHRAGKGVLMTGGDCCHISGIFGGLQDVHGPDARIGLVWFDAHGDFNTPHTTLSGMLGGMPVAVCAGLAYPTWREGSHITAPIPTNRILMVDVRNLDVAEEQLIRSTDVTIVPNVDGHIDHGLEAAVTDLASRCDLIYFHIDSDILDEAYVPNHGTREPNGPNMDQVQQAINTVMATGKVAAYAVVSVYGAGEGRDRSVESGIKLVESGLTAWKKYGIAN